MTFDPNYVIYWFPLFLHNYFPLGSLRCKYQQKVQGTKEDNNKSLYLTKSNGIGVEKQH